MDTEEASATAGPEAVPATTAGAPDEGRGSRKSRRKGRHAGRRRWPKRLAIVLCVLILAGAGAIAASYAYVNHRLNQFHKVKVEHLVKPAPPGKPFNVLLVGSDSRQFVDTPGEEKQFGSPSTQTGQRSDVIIVARFVPATHHVYLLSIPRDTYVNIPGKIPNVSGPNRINVAFDTGSASLLIETIEDVFHIPIEHYVSINFEGFADMVNALGGIYLDFSVPVEDHVSDLNVTKTGCQLVNGTTALALVRSRDLEYETPSGWQPDVQGDFSRIRRQDAFFRAVIARANSDFTNPFALNDLLNAAQKNNNVSIDSNWSGGDLLSLARQFHGISGSDLVEETIPEEEGTVDGEDILYAAEPYAKNMITGFLRQGVAPAHHSATTPTSAGGSTSTSAPTTTTTIPPNVVTNTEPEPWNPVPCSP
jgi:LCP family protein required for cell wall assembly